MGLFRIEAFLSSLCFHNVDSSLSLAQWDISRLHPFILLGICLFLQLLSLNLIRVSVPRCFPWKHEPACSRFLFFSFGFFFCLCSFLIPLSSSHSLSKLSESSLAWIVRPLSLLYCSIWLTMFALSYYPWFCFPLLWKESGHPCNYVLLESLYHPHLPLLMCVIKQVTIDECPQMSRF